MGNMEVSLEQEAKKIKITSVVTNFLINKSDIFRRLEPVIYKMIAFERTQTPRVIEE